MGDLHDGQWHRVSVGVSLSGLELHVDCSLVERVHWPYRGQGISTEGLVILGGILESFETPFEVRGPTLEALVVYTGITHSLSLLVLVHCETNIVTKQTKKRK